MVITKANSAGTRGVYDVPGVRDAIRDGEAGLLVGPSEPAELGHSALSLVPNLGECVSMCDLGMAVARGLSWRRTADLLLSLGSSGSRQLPDATLEESWL
jgi:hypothetical protein